MKKTLILFFQSLCVLLLTACGLLCAHTLQDSGQNCSLADHEWPAKCSFVTLQNHDDSLRPLSLPRKEKHQYRLRTSIAENEEEDREEEEQKLISFKKHFESGNHVRVIGDNLVSGYSIRYTQNYLSSSEHACYSVSDQRYLLLRVFRI